METVRVVGVWFALAFVTSTTSVAEESPAAWLGRILDPETIGVKPFPGSTLNRKLSVDTIKVARDPEKRHAVYLAPLDQVKAASEHFAKELRVKPSQVSGEGSEFETHVFVLKGGGDYPGKAEGLTIQITRSPWVTGNLQITMEQVIGVAGAGETPP